MSKMSDKFNDEKMEEQARIANPEKVWPELDIEGFDPKNPEHIEALFDYYSEKRTQFMEDMSRDLNDAGEEFRQGAGQRLKRWQDAVDKFLARKAGK